MTLQQLKYAVTVADTGNMTEAAEKLFISQPSLTNAIKSLEKEMHVTVFDRTNRGVNISEDGKTFLKYARQVLEQADLLEGHYKNPGASKPRFSVSCQHYSFAVNAFVDTIREYNAAEYDFTLRETETHEIIDDVSRMVSEVGILYVSNKNREIINKLLRKNELEFTEILTARPHVFISSSHPLAKKRKIDISQLEDYPYLSFEQGEYNSFYFSEEVLSTFDRKKNIKVRDRATLFNLLIGLDGYTVSSGIISHELNGENIISRPLTMGNEDIEDYIMHVGYILRKKQIKSVYAESYIKALMDHI